MREEVESSKTCKDCIILSVNSCFLSTLDHYSYYCSVNFDVIHKILHAHVSHSLIDYSIIDEHGKKKKTKRKRESERIFKRKQNEESKVEK